MQKELLLGLSAIFGALVYVSPWFLGPSLSFSLIAVLFHVSENKIQKLIAQETTSLKKLIEENNKAKEIGDLRERLEVLDRSVANLRNSRVLK